MKLDWKEAMDYRDEISQFLNKFEKWTLVKEEYEDQYWEVEKALYRLMLTLDRH